ncbi:DNA repair and recombination protein RAD54B [Coccomyxa sp. Obi]|nr:DNA repair and recombination protein RAD54B [Coccomyxa sp. Obi]
MSGNGSESTQYFTVLYTKKVPNKKRKNKSFADGVLEVKEGIGCTLYDEEGKIITRGNVKGCKDMPEGAEIPLGNWDLEVDAQIDAENFRSGQCFLKGSVGEPGVLQPPCNTAPVAFQAPGVQGSRHMPACLPSTSQRMLSGLHDPHAPDALVLNLHEWQGGKGAAPVVVDPYLGKHLRPHQREGVQFLYECVMGLREVGRFGAVLADDMGLGKTLQVIALIWTLLRQGPSGKPAVKRVIVVTPCSLAENWAAEIKKWLGNERIKALVVQAGPEAKGQVLDFKAGTVWKVMVASYETLRKHTDALAGCVDLLVCDEGHRLKAAAGNKTINALLALRCPRRILVTGTPLQNNLEEFFALVNFVNPDLLGSMSTFRRIFGDPITQSRDRGATPEEVALGQQRSAELQRRVDAFILRRTNDINAAYLPPLHSYVAFCRPTPLQVAMYKQLIRSNMVTSLLTSTGGANDSSALACIMAMRKLCNHPDLLFVGDDLEASGLEADLHPLFPAGYQLGQPQHSGKMLVLEGLLVEILGGASGERAVVVSSSTKTLDRVAALCEGRGWTTVRICGDVSAAKRQEIVNAFNRHNVGQVLLLSAKAGGAGLNLIGANRLVLFDTDWNPATDLQAMARIWRDGQTKPCTIYRLLTTGTIDEKMYQRQLMKGELADTMEQGSKQKGPSFTREELRALFSLNTDTSCETAVIMQGSANAQDWQDVKDSLEDAPLKACVASGHVSYVRKIANEQDILRDKQKAREASPPISEGAGNGHCMSGAEESAELSRVEAAIAEDQREADSLFHDDVDCLDMDV